MCKHCGLEEEEINASPVYGMTKTVARFKIPFVRYEFRLDRIIVPMGAKADEIKKEMVLSGIKMPWQ